jgi:hypothetical protein
MANRLDPDLLQIINRQVRQDLKVDPVVPERLLIGLQAEAAQPFSDVQLRLRRPLSSFSLLVSRQAADCCADGRTFWFNRNRLSGSCLAFSATRRR